VLLSILLLTMSQPADSPQPHDQDRGVIYKEICDLFKAMIDNLDMMVEKELQGRQSRLKSLFTPRSTSMDPSMTATPYDAPSMAQPSTLLAPSTYAIPLAPMHAQHAKTSMESKENITYLCIDTKSSTIVLHWNKPRMACQQKGENNESMHMLVASGVYI
jgi:hypothetical protein